MSSRALRRLQRNKDVIGDQASSNGSASEEDVVLPVKSKKGKKKKRSGPVNPFDLVSVYLFIVSITLQDYRV